MGRDEIIGDALTLIAKDQALGENDDGFLALLFELLTSASFNIPPVI